MEKLKRMAQVAGIVLIPFFLSACFSLNIVENVKNPSRYFKKAYRQIEEIHRHNPNREGRAQHLHLLVYDGSDHQIVEITVPLWLVNDCVNLSEEIAEIGKEVDFEERYDFDWRGIEDLEEIGPGLLVEIDDEESRILIWLE